MQDLIFTTYVCRLGFKYFPLTYYWFHKVSQTNKWACRAWRRLIAGFSLRRPGFDGVRVHVDLFIHGVALGHTLLLTLRFYLANYCFTSVPCPFLTLGMRNAHTEDIISPDHRRIKTCEFDKNNHQAKRAYSLTTGSFGCWALGYMLHHRATQPLFTLHRSSTQQRLQASPFAPVHVSVSPPVRLPPSLSAINSCGLDKLVFI